MWKLNLDGGRVNLVVGQESKPVKCLREGKHLMEIDFLMVSMAIVTLNLKDYSVEGSGSSPSGRRKFVGLWKSHFLPCEWPDKTQSNDGTSSADELVDRSAYVLTDMEPSGQGVKEKRTDNCTAGSQDILLKEQYRGTHLVHIRNLVAPMADRRSRVIDMDHVSQLIQSFREEDMGQIVILAGLIDEAVDALSLKEAGTGNVECLGGNHTREALLALLEEGTLRYSHVQVRLYSNLSREAALAIGFAHNHITHEKRKCVTFMDKVRLMRDLLPAEQTPASLRVWKSALALIFKKKDGRQLQRQFSHHLVMARLPASVWEALIQAAQGLDITERLFRPVVRLREEYLEELFRSLKEGVPHFKRELRTMLSDNNKVKKPPKEKVKPQPAGAYGEPTVYSQQDLVDMEQQWENGDLIEESEVGDDVTTLKKEIDRLKALNEALVKENTELKEEQCKLQKKLQEASQQKKRKCSSTSDVTPGKKSKEDFIVRQRVWAKFTDGIYYPAVILEVNKSGFKVRWLEDNVEGCLKADELRPFS